MTIPNPFTFIAIPAPFSVLVNCKDLATAKFLSLLVFPLTPEPAEVVIIFNVVNVVTSNWRFNFVVRLLDKVFVF